MNFKKLIRIFLSFCLAFATGLLLWKMKKNPTRASLENLSLRESLQSQLEEHPKDAKNSQPIPSEEFLIRIQDEEIRDSDINFEYDLYMAGFEKESDLLLDLVSRKVPHEKIEPLRQKVLDSLVERKLLHKYILQDREFEPKLAIWTRKCEKSWEEKKKEPSIKELLDKEGYAVRFQKRLCELVLVEQYIQEKIDSKISIEQNEKKVYFDSHPDEYQHPEMVKIHHIVMQDEKEAKRIRSKLTKQNFSDFARTYSSGGEAETGGVLGPFPKGVMPAFFDVAFSMQVGDISPVIKSDFGYHIILLVRQIPSGHMSFLEAAPRIEKTLSKRVREKQYENLIDKALRVIKIQM